MKMTKQTRTSNIYCHQKVAPNVARRWTLLSPSVLALSACGGDSSTPLISYTTQSGFALKGPLEAFRIFEDANGNGVFDAGEASSLTAADGSFSVTVGEGALLSGEGTADSVDHASGKTVEGLFMAAPVGASVMSPMTTVLAQTDLTEAELRQALGLSVDLLEYNPFSPENTGSGHARAAELSAQQIATITRSLTALADGSDLTARASFDVASAALNSVLADHVDSGAGGVKNLWGDNTVGAILTAYRSGLADAGYSTVIFDALRAELDAGIDIINQRILAVGNIDSAEAKAVFGLASDFLAEIKAAVADLAAGNDNPGLTLDSWTAITAKVAENGYTPPPPPPPVPNLTVNATGLAFTATSDRDGTLEMMGGDVLGTLVAGNAFTLLAGGGCGHRHAVCARQWSNQPCFQRDIYTRHRGE